VLSRGANFSGRMDDVVGLVLESCALEDYLLGWKGGATVYKGVVYNIKCGVFLSSYCHAG
jgi:hypothetical protein